MISAMMMVMILLLVLVSIPVVNAGRNDDCHEECTKAQGCCSPASQFASKSMSLPVAAIIFSQKC